MADKAGVKACMAREMSAKLWSGLSCGCIVDDVSCLSMPWSGGIESERERRKSIEKKIYNLDSLLSSNEV